MKTITQVKENKLNSVEFVIHKITKDDNEKKGGWYRQTLALSGLLSRTLKRWNEYWYKKKYQTYDSRVKFSSYNEEDEELRSFQKERMSKEIGTEESNKMFPEPTIIHHESVWDFFQYIEYDYKNKLISNTDTQILIKKKKPVS